ncbi:MAG: SDR family NAD(P)-dependent oxidoreductase [Verrucomicrobiales bacterium]|nr:SDR family NAD(P)-dependent oxidoreductase [Verrucomicrobiales bacterium]
MITPPCPSTSRVVWITGASGGLGRQLVKQFRSQGDIVIAGFRTRHDFREDTHLAAVRLDVTQAASVQTAYETILARWQRVDILINNAGIARDRLLAQMTEAEWDEVMEVNLRGAFLCSRTVVESFAARRSGQIVNIGSFAAKRGHSGQANYAATKAGLLGFTQSLAQELGPHQVQVNAVLPGVLPTGMTAELSAERLAGLAAENVLGRLNDLEEVARFIGFLTTLKNVSGQIFQLDSRISRWV